tara:strand:+ start:1301 stop:1480 length:180 start_codon:yes stop_codon:yes gene_type:complete
MKRIFFYVIALGACLNWIMFYYELIITEQLDIIALAGSALLFTAVVLMLLKWDHEIKYK